MRKDFRYALMLWLPMASGPLAAMDYIVDFSRVKNLETLRPLVKGCADFDAMEPYRRRMETAANLETLRTELAANGMGLFNRCPAGITGEGIAAVKAPAATVAPGYSVDFTRVGDFESLRPLIEGCTDFGGLENFRPKLEAAANLNDMAATLRNVGFAMFDACPAGVSGAGIKLVK